MACCAFAAFLLMQLLAPFVWLRDRIFGPRAERMDGAAAWSPGAAAVVLRAPPRIAWRRGLIFAVAVEVAVLAVGYQALVRSTPTPTDAAMTWTDALHASWCGTGPLATRSLTGD
jgi:hypothetical protein